MGRNSDFYLQTCCPHRQRGQQDFQEYFILFFSLRLSQFLLKFTKFILAIFIEVKMTYFKLTVTWTPIYIDI